MQFTIVSILALATFGLAADSHLRSWSETGCDKGDVVNWTVHSGGIKCEKLGNVKSMKVLDLAPGCTATIYSDTNCSNDKKAARVGNCEGYGGKKVQSFSVDCK